VGGLASRVTGRPGPKLMAGSKKRTQENVTVDKQKTAKKKEGCLTKKGDGYSIRRCHRKEKGGNSKKTRREKECCFVGGGGGGKKKAKTCIPNLGRQARERHFKKKGVCLLGGGGGLRGGKYGRQWEREGGMYGEISDW